jgi:dGTPase
MDLSDDIAYGVHDLEDAIALHLVTEASFRDMVKESDCVPFLNHLKATYPKDCGNDVYDYLVRGLFSTSKQRKRFIGRLVHLFVTNARIETVEQLEEPLIRYRAALPDAHRKFLDSLQKLIEAKVIFTPNVQHLEFKGQKMVISVFEALRSDTENLLPEDARLLFDSSGADVRVICDYVAGMTDAFLLKTYDRLFSPRMGSVFDKL